MFKDYYTTAMSGEGKMLEKRFKNIMTRKKSSKLRSAIASVMLCVITAATLFCSGALAYAVGSYSAGDIAVIVNGRSINLNNKPFVDNYEVYVPLRETLNKCGVTDSNITYLNGKVNITLYSDVTASDHTAHINIGAQNITFDGDTAGAYKLANGARTTTHPAILKDGVTYVPVGMLSRIKQYDVEIEDEEQHIKGFRYNRALPVKLLKGLTIRKYDEVGFDVVLADWTVAESLNPEDYYENGEKVIIGNAQKQEEQGYHQYVQTNWYNYPANAVKRILTDDDGKVIAVVPVENQKHEAINGSGISSQSWGFSWEGINNNTIGVPKKGAERGDLESMDWYVSNSGVYKPNTHPMELCFYIPVELITYVKETPKP